MTTRVSKTSLALTLGLLGGATFWGPVFADRFWLVWEQSGSATACAEGQDCVPAIESRPFLPQDRDLIQRLFASGIAPDTRSTAGSPLVCSTSGQITPPEDLAQTLIELPPSEKILALRGTGGVFFDLTGLKSPPGAGENFGASIHAAFVDRFRAAGLTVYSEEEVEQVPGRPKLAIFFSFTDPDGDCEYTYSAFSSVSQDVVLARDPSVKITAGVWSHSVKRDPGNQNESEFDAILKIADAFITDWLTANAQ